MLTVEEIRSYWEDRACGDSTAQSTTQDVYLREIERRVLTERIARIKPTSVADIGCGDGRTTIGIAMTQPGIAFHGFDYSAAMVENARGNLNAVGLANASFASHNICEPLKKTFDLAYSTRCLINLPSWDLQRVALQNIHDSLSDGGCYLMIENFIEGHENFNLLRSRFGLPEIAVRHHNLFFKRDYLLENIANLFSLEEELNISSTYYMVSRILYSRLCADTHMAPDYFDEHHRYGAELPFAGEYGPVRLLILRKK